MQRPRNGKFSRGKRNQKEDKSQRLQERGELSKMQKLPCWVEWCCSPGTCESDLLWEKGLCRCYKVKMRSCWIRRGLKFSIIGALLRGERFGHRDIEEEGHGKMETETQVTCHQANESQGFPAMNRSLKRQGRLLLQSLQRDGQADLDFRLQDSRTVKEYISVVLSYPVVVFCYSRPRK